MIRGLRLCGGKSDLRSPEVLCALVRRCAAFNCPCAPAVLVNTVLRSVGGVSDKQALRESIPEILEQMVAYGDLIEASEAGAESSGKLLYAALPAFVELSPTQVLLLGIAPDDVDMVPKELTNNVAYRGASRRLRLEAPCNIRGVLLAAGYKQTTVDEWLKSPRVRSVEDHIRLYEPALSRSERPGVVDGLEILNTSLPVTFYPGRWQTVKTHSGVFVARRPRPYGAPLWSVVRLSSGTMTNIVDLPLIESNWRGCDEAWHLQQAIDASEGHPQVYRLRDSDGPRQAVDFFSPIPAWAQRRWDYLATRIPRLRSLLAYEFDRESLEGELKFARERMWLASAHNSEA